MNFYIFKTNFHKSNTSFYATLNFFSITKFVKFVFIILKIFLFNYFTKEIYYFYGLKILLVQIKVF